MSELCTKAGWQFQDLVVWDKGKSLPWTHKGRFRNVCEYILLLSKGDLRHFNVDAVRNAENLSSYWKKYPERYNPLGSAPTDLWHFPIPVQGAWGTGGVRHACPFPLELVNRMVQLTTRQNDLILDPFAGSGSVLAMARACGRLAIGFDLSEDYKNAFLLSGRNQLLSDAANLLRASHGRSMGQTIIELRTLKTAVTLLKHVSRHDRFGDSAISCCRGVTVWRQPASSESSLAKALVTFYYDVAVESDIACHLSKAVLDSPVAKFCLEVEAKVMPISSFDSAIRGACKALWLYNNGRFYESGRQIDCDEAIQMTGHRHRAGSWPPLISNVNPMAESVAE
ncbi:MAG: hypothetical protein QOJ65_255 [Fimbriimonadaceae bacterium]|nr:hypothetical protein [Fimbriimonadaceae bacterium]